MLRDVLIASAAGAALLLLTQVPAAAETAPSRSQGYKIPRTADGHPDLQGMYDLATITPFERPAGAPAVYTKEEARKLETAAAKQRAQGDQPIDGNRTAPPKGGDGSLGPAGNVGGYNTVGWIPVRPSPLSMVRHGHLSLSIRPTAASHRLRPRPRKERGRRHPRADRRRIRRKAMTPVSIKLPELMTIRSAVRSANGAAGFRFDVRPSGATRLFYNNLHQIVQTPDTVIILTEMVHDARIIRMNGQHLPKTIRQWMGDSVGRWEGDTLVVDTTNFTRQDAVPRVNGEPARSGAVYPRRQQDASVSVHGRRPGHLVAAVDWHVFLAGHQRKDVRIRLPRRKLCAH